MTDGANGHSVRIGFRRSSTDDYRSAVQHELSAFERQELARISKDRAERAQQLTDRLKLSELQSLASPARSN